MVSFSDAGCSTGIKGAKQMLVFALDTIRDTDAILERLGKIKRIEDFILNCSVLSY